MKVLYVGRTTRGQLGGLRRRLITHRKKIGSARGCKFRCLIVKKPRDRALLEAYATGFLCPKHIGLADKEKLSQMMLDAPAPAPQQQRCV
jgi:hypothetical protein